MFESFFFAGFECATGYNSRKEPIDQIAATQHDRFAAEDYELIAGAGMRAAREGVRWNLVDRNGRYDFSSIRPMIEASRANDVEVIWDLFHYGYPDDVDLFSDSFPARFAEYCYAVARYIAARTDGTCYFTPVNEPSFFSWAAGHVGRFAPHVSGRGGELKVCLARAGIQAIEAIWDACPGARIVNVDPICRVVPPDDSPEMAAAAQQFNEEAVFESWDMLCGRLRPELGGSRRHLDIPGLNYYWTNQWVYGTHGPPLPDGDPRCCPMADLVRAVWHRYGGDLLITETAHVDENRPAWIRQLACECEELLDEGIPLRGVCLYPILGMPEWHAQDEWTRMGLWDLIPRGEELARVPYEPALQALFEARRLDGRQHSRRGRMLAGIR